MLPKSTPSRVFLFLQGPHGPFFFRLGQMLAASGAQVWRVGFNAGDRAFWSASASYIPYRGTLENWPQVFAELAKEKGITDLVLYGDVRPIHAEAIRHAKSAGITVHVFEEGYLRPYWITYERDGSNGNSRLMQLSVPDMAKALRAADLDTHLPPARWGDMRHHVFYGALYHGVVLAFNFGYGQLRPHRGISVRREFALYLRRLLLMPLHALHRRLATWRIQRGGFPYHLALLQLEHDSAFQAHSRFETMQDFITLVIDTFSRSAPAHHHLVFKAHPLEDGRTPLRQNIRQAAKARGISSRVHFVRGGKLARLLDECRSAVTVNSTAAQQALWRGIPLKSFGSAVYNKSKIVSSQPLAQFFAAPKAPDAGVYRNFRRFLLRTSQLPGGFYAATSRHQALRHVVDLMLQVEDPYEKVLKSPPPEPQQALRLAHSSPARLSNLK